MVSVVKGCYHFVGLTMKMLSDDGNEHEEYGVNKLNFDATEEEIEKLRKEYHIPDDITLSCHREHSSAKHIPTETATILIEELSDEEGEPHSKKPRRAMHKNEG
ncbi:hypothetical protein WN944_003078 [Citrus x changshan-huyou]|uniref:Uncharacterized protein n=1 Tax=Citrus x changshan-huyou TaxID=2935761 RepID=A0AAP0QH59_9ROSI